MPQPKKNLKGVNELNLFANALRAVLDLDPLPTPGARSGRKDTDLERFYVHPFELPQISNRTRL